MKDFLNWLLPLWLKRALRSKAEWDAYYLEVARKIQAAEAGAIVEVEEIYDIERAKKRFSVGANLDR